MKEKRKETRRPVDEYLFVWDNRDNSLVGQVVDMTVSGIMLLTREPIEPNQTLYCQMTLPELTDGFQFINLELHSRWCTRNDVGLTFKVGFEMRNLSPESKAVVRRFIQTWRASESETILF
jgi:hypothetical protein